MNLRRKRADDLLARDYEALRATVSAGARAQLARKNIHFDPVDMEAFYNQAWQGCTRSWPRARRSETTPGGSSR